MLVLCCHNGGKYILLHVVVNHSSPLIDQEEWVDSRLPTEVWAQEHDIYCSCLSHVVVERRVRDGCDSEPAVYMGYV